MFLGPLLIRSCAMAILVVNSPYTSQVGSVPSSLVFIKNPTDAVIVNHTSWSMKMKSTPLSSFPEKIFFANRKAINQNVAADTHAISSHIDPNISPQISSNISSIIATYRKSDKFTQCGTSNSTH
uniref:Uncharacterized protein n=1 Tax=Corethron hystrix TaxID=216773 RepID=A0A7S1BUI3_9STRA|mmetsp:Transcript_39269/g.91622  ORF Transcript_39269/g.91622 Transcript_39269/m.91622 type:complete len:125 (+) Transcript_39269:460-834(+)